MAGRISAVQAKEIFESDKNVIMLDVRTLDEYAEAHVPGSMLIPYDQIGMRAAAELPDKNATIIVYCRSGNRSGIAAGKLATLGYTSIYDMGGLFNWRFPVETGVPR